MKLKTVALCGLLTTATRYAFYAAVQKAVDDEAAAGSR
jgi:hypothetical protein